VKPLQEDAVMHKHKTTISVTSLVILLILTVGLLSGRKTNGQERTDDSGRVAAEQWEYLAVAGPSTTNLTPTGNSRMRKEPNIPFGREAFVLEQHMDKLGANGWELVTVAGPPTDPVYYFRRRK
jgi:hypothetical protein